MIISTIVAIAIVGTILLVLYWLFPLIEVNGDSMLPTFKDGEILIGKRVSKHHKYQVGNVYVYFNPFADSEEVHVIKRLSHIRKDGSLYFRGDNAKVSFDSRYYGSITKELVVAKVLFRGEKKNGKTEKSN